MKRFESIVPYFATIILCCAVLGAWPGAVQAQSALPPLVAAGSGVNLGITRLLATAFMVKHPEVTIEVPGSIGTKGAITAASEGAITFGLISRALKEDEKAPGLVVRPYARVPFVVGAHTTVVDDDVTFQDLVDIVKGTKNRWKNGKEIIVQTREPFDSGIQLLEKLVPGFKEAYAESHQAKRRSVTFTDQDANKALSATPYAIGFTDLGMIMTEHLSIKALKLNGIAPSPDSILSGQYPLSRELLFLYREETLPREARAFLDFAHSEEGSQILRSNGYLPVN